MALPIACELGRTCEVQNYVDLDAGPGVKDYRCGTAAYDKHSGVDIRILDVAAQRRGVDVLAVAPGVVTGVRDEMPDIMSDAPGAPSDPRMCGNGVAIDHGGGWVTQTCHMARGSLSVAVGQRVAAGQRLGQVGLSGATEFPHVHVTVWKDGQVVDPFAPNAALAASCQPQASLWTAQAARGLAYKPGVIFNTGFAPGPVTGPSIEQGGIPTPDRTSAYLVAYVTAINLRAGDRAQLTLRGPDGAVLATDTHAPVERSKAEYFMLVGKRRPGAAWPVGSYAAEARILRPDLPPSVRRFTLRL
ncbi:M23 family metallopeptidase [Phenylobacterium sp.]|jgi:hypothetical protein|uniref:M23 family metallopeptidase n=1 Tax=Phenylobacterium sp. TaxID=1871053 RepID=UPI002F9431F0